MSPVKYERICRDTQELSDTISVPEEIYFDYDDDSDIAVFRSLGEKYPNTTSLRIMPGFEEAYHDLDVINSIPIIDESFESLEKLLRLENLDLYNSNCKRKVVLKTDIA